MSAPDRPPAPGGGAVCGRERILRGAVALGLCAGVLGAATAATDAAAGGRAAAVFPAAAEATFAPLAAATPAPAAQQPPQLPGDPPEPVLRPPMPQCIGDCRGLWDGGDSFRQWRGGSAAAPPKLEWWSPRLLGWLESGKKDAAMRPAALGDPPAVVLPRAASATQLTFWGRNPWGRVRVHVRDRGDWRTATSPHPAQTNDSTQVLRFDGLQPATAHPYATDLEVNGTWKAHYDAYARTFPPPGAPVNFSFGFGSCIDPNFIGTRSGSSLALLPRWQPALSFFAFIGDYIYFWDHLEHRTEEYLLFYRRRAATALVLSAQRAMPWFMQYDDHEVHNDFAAHLPDHAGWFAPAMRAWDAYAASANPPSPVPEGRWYTVTHGNAELFFVDTRSYKVPTANLSGPLLGAAQLDALLLWLRTKCARALLVWCFLVSPVIFSHGSYRKDLWYGHMLEQRKVLDAMSAPGRAPVTILSGDSHLAGAWEVAPPGVYEYSCSPVDAFGLNTYPERVPPQFRPKDRRRKRKKGSEEQEPYWAPLGLIPPPRYLFKSRPAHLGPAGYNCLVSLSTVQGKSLRLRLDVVDGLADPPRTLFTHCQNYSAPA